MALHTLCPSSLEAPGESNKPGRKSVYKCKVCGAVSPPRQAMRVYTITRVVSPRTVSYLRDTQFGPRYVPTTERERREIEAELPVCVDCHGLLLDGLTLAQVQQFRRPQPAPLPATDPAVGADGARGEAEVVPLLPESVLSAQSCPAPTRSRSGKPRATKFSPKNGGA